VAQVTTGMNAQYQYKRGNGVEIHRIQCPYCAVGHGFFEVMHKNGHISADRTKLPKCDCCGRYFKVKAQLRFSGESIWGDDRRDRYA
jgi:transposase-like protein